MLMVRNVLHQYLSGLSKEVGRCKVVPPTSLCSTFFHNPLFDLFAENRRHSEGEYQSSCEMKEDGSVIMSY